MISVSIKYFLLAAWPVIKYNKSDPMKWSFYNGQCDFNSSFKTSTFGSKLFQPSVKNAQVSTFGFSSPKETRGS